MVLFPGALGDLVLALPALRALRARHARAQLVLVVNDRLQGLASLTGVADATAPLDGAEVAALCAGAALPAWLADQPRVYSWFGAGDDAVRRRIAAASSRVRFLRVERGAGRAHAAVAYLRAVDAPSRTARPGLTAAGRIVAPASPAADALWAGCRRPVLVLHRGAGAPAKCWASEGFSRVAEWWAARGGIVLELVGPAEAARPVVPGTTVLRDWPLHDVGAVLARSTVYLGNDSGISHLAGAVGSCGVVLFGPTDPARWRPLAGTLRPIRASTWEPAGIPLRALPAARVIGACRRTLALTRGNPDTSVGS